MGGEIVISQEASDALEIVAHPVGEAALVEFVTPTLGDFGQRVGQVRIAEDCAFMGGWREIGLLRILIFFQHAAFVGGLKAFRAKAPVIGNHFRDRRTLAGIGDCGLQIVGNRQLSEPLMQGKPTIHRTRHGDGRCAERRDFLAVHEFVCLGLHLGKCCALRAAA